MKYGDNGNMIRFPLPLMSCKYADGIQDRKRNADTRIIIIIDEQFVFYNLLESTDKCKSYKQQDLIGYNTTVDCHDSVFR